MPTEQLKQALDALKYTDTEQNVGEMISKLLELPVEAVERVIYAWESVREQPVSWAAYVKPNIFDGIGCGAGIPDDVQTAIRVKMKTAFRRTALRHFIGGGKSFLVKVQDLTADHRKMCSGCPHSIPCYNGNRSDPEKCYNGVGVYFDNVYYRFQNVSVTPLKLNKTTVTVSCEHPLGEFKVPIEKIIL